MAPPVDPNNVLMTGENSFIRLSLDGGKTLSDRASHWRVLWCPAGTGHALFIESELTNRQVRIYSDNIAVARWLQRTIETLLYPSFTDTKSPVIEASFERVGDPRSAATETVLSRDDELTLTWYDAHPGDIPLAECQGTAAVCTCGWRREINAAREDYPEFLEVAFNRLYVWADAHRRQAHLGPRAANS